MSRPRAHYATRHMYLGWRDSFLDGVYKIEVLKHRFSFEEGQITTAL